MPTKPLPLFGASLLAVAKDAGSTLPPPQSTGCSAMDETLDGGFRFGEITSIAGGKNTGKTMILHHLIAQYLLSPSSTSHSNAQVYLIDTTGLFSFSRQRDVLVNKLAKQTEHLFRSRGYIYDKALIEEERREKAAALLARATGLLERLKVIRVFDLLGLMEATSEMSDMMRGSETPDEEIEDENSSRSSIGMVFVDNIANVLGDAMAKNHILGQSQSKSFHASLRQLTIEHGLCSVLVNGVISSPSSGESRHRIANDGASRFQWSNVRPALGRSFAFLLDRSILLSRVPRNHEDAEMMIGAGPGREITAQSAIAVEVLHDRHGSPSSIYRWSVFRIQNTIELVPVDTP